MNRAAARVLLVSMPMAEPTLPNLGMEVLAQVIRGVGLACDVFYGSLRMPRRVGRRLLHSIGGQAVFTPLVCDVDPMEVAEALAGATYPGCNTPDFDDRVVEILVGIDAAQECLDVCLAEIPVGCYDVAAFSLTFDAQKLPSIALATRLKEREPALRVVFGGTACDGGMGVALMEAFPVIDAVVEGDGEAAIVPLLAASRGERPFAEVPSCHYRTSGTVQTSGIAALKVALAAIPRPDYDEYLRQKAASAYAKDHVILMFEASRGCWWGAKHHCTFCGLRADGLTFREAPADAVVNEVRRLQTLYRPDLVYATDAILGLGTLRDAIPAIARWRRASREPLNLFFEIKSNLRRRDIAALAAAGASELQPGIESFSTHHLELIKKGATALQQIACLKWAASYHMGVTYALMIGVPGERVADYDQALGFMRKLHHFPPPMQVNLVVLDQFSPYAREPERYGIRDVRPLPEHPIIYQSSDPVWLLRATYERGYDHDNHVDPVLIERRQELREELARWHRDFVAGNSLLGVYDGDRIGLHRTHNGLLSVHYEEGPRAALLRLGEDVCTMARAERSIDAEPAIVAALLDGLDSDGLVVRENGHFLSVVQPLGLDAWADAGLDSTLSRLVVVR